MGLRDTVLKICVETVEEITGGKRNSGISAEDWAPVLMEDPDFLLTILRRAARANVCALEEKDKLRREEVAELKEIHTRDKNQMQARIKDLKDSQNPKRPLSSMPASASIVPSSTPSFLLNRRVRRDS